MGSVIILFGLFLPFMIAEIMIYKKDKEKRLLMVEDDYSLRHARKITWYGIIGMLVGTLGIFLFPHGQLHQLAFLEWLELLGFLTLLIMGILLTIYAFRWKIVVKGNVLTLHRAFGKVQTVNFEDVSQARYRGGTFKIYLKKGRNFSVNTFSAGFDFLEHQCYQTGKMDQIQQQQLRENANQGEKFFIVEKNPESLVIVCAIIAFFISVVGMFVYRGVVLPADPDNVYWVYLAIAIFFMIFVAGSIYTLLWHVKVNPYRIEVRNTVGIKRTHPLSRITRVNIKDPYVLLYSKGKRIAKIHNSSRDIPFMLRRFQQVGVMCQLNEEPIEITATGEYKVKLIQGEFPTFVAKIQKVRLLIPILLTLLMGVGYSGINLSAFNIEEESNWYFLIREGSSWAFISEGSQMWLLLLPVILFLTLHILLWRITTENETIKIRNILGMEKSYQIKAIDKIKLQDKNFMMYIGKKNIGKIPHFVKASPHIWQRLEIEKIPIYHYGKRIEKSETGRYEMMNDEVVKSKQKRKKTKTS